ncbi:MAG TPA: hypothetical protein VFO66_12155, partial [Gemmatimonadaceae bacterium]|nr:hypothetical protein [Gemmatimonadaceae bacterium]
GVGLSLTAADDFRDAGDAVERSGIVNSLAAQEFGSDYTDPYRVRGATLEASFGERVGLRWRLAGSVERHDALGVHAAPSFGRHEGVLALASADAYRGALRVDRPTRLSFLGTELAFDGELRVTGFEPVGTPPVAAPGTGDSALESRSTVTRGSFSLRLERPWGGRRLTTHTIGVIADGNGAIPATELAMFGGPVSGPGYDYHSLFGRAGLSQRVELQVPVPFPSLSLGRFGRSPAEAKLIPFIHAVGIHGSDAAVWREDASGLPAARQRRRVDGVYPSAGIGLLTLFDLLRFDVARGLRDGRWTFNVDVTREFWRVL